MYHALAPGPWFRSASETEFCALYLAQLDRLDPNQVLRELAALAEGMIPALLCFERPPPDPPGAIAVWLPAGSMTSSVSRCARSAMSILALAGRIPSCRRIGTWKGRTRGAQARRVPHGATEPLCAAHLLPHSCSCRAGRRRWPGLLALPREPREIGTRVCPSLRGLGIDCPFVWTLPSSAGPGALDAVSSWDCLSLLREPLGACWTSPTIARPPSLTVTCWTLIVCSP